MKNPKIPAKKQRDQARKQLRVAVNKLVESNPGLSPFEAFHSIVDGMFSSYDLGYGDKTLNFGLALTYLDSTKAVATAAADYAATAVPKETPSKSTTSDWAHTKNALFQGIYSWNLDKPAPKAPANIYFQLSKSTGIANLKVGILPPVALPPGQTYALTGQELASVGVTFGELGKALKTWPLALAKSDSQDLVYITNTAAPGQW